MGTRNYLIDGVSGTGKSAICAELRRRGHHTIDGDTDLAYQGNPITGEPKAPSPHTRPSHWNHIWDITRVHAIASDCTTPVTFFCGGCRNQALFVAVFDAVMILEIDARTLRHRLRQRPVDEYGGVRSERDLVLQLHRRHRDHYGDNAISIDASAPLNEVVDTILGHTR